MHISIDDIRLSQNDVEIMLKYKDFRGKDL
jgi:hypothetical protein